MVPAAPQETVGEAGIEPGTAGFIFLLQIWLKKVKVKKLNIINAQLKGTVSRDLNSSINPTLVTH
jgi:hypothetical protein